MIDGMSNRSFRSMRDKPATPFLARRDTHLTHAESPVRVGIDARVPDVMPRAEDDRKTRLGNPDVHDRPGSGSDTARRHEYF